MQTKKKNICSRFWSNAKQAEIIVRNLRSKKKWVDDYTKCVDLAEELQLLFDFYKEGDASEEDVDLHYQQTLLAIEDIEFRNMLSDEGDNLSAVLQITAGAGGTESCDWAKYAHAHVFNVGRKTRF